MSNLYYVAGIPFSDELYHSGTKGQKWGVRRFQNADGTWTELGKRMRRVREGAGDFAKKAGEVIKTNAIKLRDAAHRRRIKKHPERMTDEELASYSQRLQMEKNYQQMLADTRMLRKKGKVDVAQLMQSFGNSALKGFGEKFGEKVGTAIGGVAQKKIEERHMDELDALKRQNALLTERTNVFKNRVSEGRERENAREWERGRVQREIASRTSDRQAREQNRQLLAQEREQQRQRRQQQRQQQRQQRQQQRP